MYYVYIIENIIDKSWYIGFATDVNKRLQEHNTKSGGKHTRRKTGQWNLIYFEGYLCKLDALGREKFLKSGSGRRFIKKQIRNYLSSINSADVAQSVEHILGKNEATGSIPVIGSRNN